MEKTYKNRTKAQWKALLGQREGLGCPPQAVVIEALDYYQTQEISEVRVQARKDVFWTRFIAIAGLAVSIINSLIKLLKP